MIFPIRAPRWAMLPQRIRGMFNLNDPRWGRGDDKASDDANRPEDRPRRGGAIQGLVASRPIWMSCGATLTASCLACSGAAMAAGVAVMAAGFSQTCAMRASGRG